jgi:hypothetical protein
MEYGHYGGLHYLRRVSLLTPRKRAELATRGEGVLHKKRRHLLLRGVRRALRVCRGRNEFCLYAWSVYEREDMGYNLQGDHQKFAHG